MPVCELVDHKVANDDSLEDKQTLYFGPSFDQLVVGTDANNHVNSHHEGLETDPTLLESVTDRRLILRVIEVFSTHPAVSCFLASLLKHDRFKICAHFRYLTYNYKSNLSNHNYLGFWGFGVLGFWGCR